MLYRTIAEYDVAIADAQAAIKRTTDLGSEYIVESGANKRATKENALFRLSEHLGLLQKERIVLERGRGASRYLSPVPGW